MSTPTILALASEVKGLPFIEECARQGYQVIVLMDEKLTHEDWPWDSISEHFGMPSVRQQPDVTHAVSYLARDRHISRIIGLDDYDVETAADLREHMRLNGMGASAARLFRDKLAMRMKAKAAGIAVPNFTGIFNFDTLRAFMAQTPAPWVFKPRTLAGSEGIRKLHDSEELWRLLDEVGDEKSFHLLEQFIPGDVYHVDALSYKGEVIFALVSKYGAPPMATLQGRGIFTTRVLPRESPVSKELSALNETVVQTMGRDFGPTHTEFIQAEDGSFYFLETAARVGGGNIEWLIQAASGINIWQEAARLELADLRGESYHLPEIRNDYAGLIAAPSKTPFVDTSAYADPEITLRSSSAEFASLIVGSPDYERVEHLLADYSERFAQDFLID